MAISSSTRTLWVFSSVWLLLMGACAYIAYPSIGAIAISITPNPFWEVAATGVPQSPFAVTANWGYLLAVSLGPVLALWLAAFVFRRSRPRSSRHAA